MIQALQHELSCHRREGGDPVIAGIEIDRGLACAPPECRIPAFAGMTANM